MKTTKTQATITILDDTRLADTLSLECLVRSWPSLGITEPVFGLRRVYDPANTVVAKGTDRAALLRWAAKNSHAVRRAA